MKENFTQWLDIFRLYAFVCFEENDENIRILEDSYHEGGLGLHFYNGAINEPNLNAYETLFKSLEFLSYEELYGLKNIIENDYFSDEENFKIVYANNLWIYEMTSFSLLSEDIF